ncbi:hypothetical protein HY497_02365 [Candidatus Woesearchaeota archaeon]|nr:hypothetical protein [Candidatus Woesearchaeota archaeon]
MVEFIQQEEEHHPKAKKKSIDEHLGEEDVAEQALRIAVEQHQRQHHTKGEDHHVHIRKQDKLISEDEERVIDEIKKQDHPKDEAYKRATAESASGAYGRADGGSYGGHTHSEASCSCGWRATPEHAMNEFMQTQQDKKKKGTSQYAAGDDDGPGGVYGKAETLEGIAHGYQSSMSDGNSPTYQ